VIEERPFDHRAELLDALIGELGDRDADLGGTSRGLAAGEHPDLCERAFVERALQQHDVAEDVLGENLVGEVERAQSELRACGVAVTRVPGEPDALRELTPQQRQIVRLASDGLSDREIADRPR
jgi:DNA-binding NarL/FixJ family response regulator